MMSCNDVIASAMQIIAHACGFVMHNQLQQGNVPDCQHFSARVCVCVRERERDTHTHIEREGEREGGETESTRREERVRGGGREKE